MYMEKDKHEKHGNYGSIFLGQAINNSSILVKGSKDRFRDFVHVNDVVRSFILANNYSNSSNFNFYNICSSTKTKVEDIINLIQSNFTNKIDVKYHGSTPGDIHGIVGDFQNSIKTLDGT